MSIVESGGGAVPYEIDALLAQRGIDLSSWLVANVESASGFRSIFDRRTNRVVARLAPGAPIVEISEVLRDYQNGRYRVA